VVRLDAQTLPWEGDGVDLHLPFAVGRLGLQLEAEGRRHAVPVRVRPAPAKVDETAWEALLAELEAWLPGLVTGAEGPRVGHVGLRGAAPELLRLEGTGADAAFVGTGPDAASLELLFNPTFAGALAPVPQHGRVTVSRQREDRAERGPDWSPRAGST